MLQFPDIDPIIFSVGPFFGIGPIAPRWYGMAYLFGFLYTYSFMRKHYQWLRLKRAEQVDSVLGFLILGMLLGSRMTYVLFYNFESYREGPWWGVFAVWQGGLAFHGGFMGAMLATVFVCRRYKIPMLRMWDILLVPAPLAIGFGRVTNFINGELWGRVTDVPWGMVFPTGGPDPRHPSQLYEALAEGFLLFAFARILWIYKPRPGLLAGIWGIWYAVARTWMEIYREPDAQLGYLWGGYTMGQFLSISLFVSGIGCLIWVFNRKISPEEALEDANRVSAPAEDPYSPNKKKKKKKKKKKRR